MKDSSKLSIKQNLFLANFPFLKEQSLNSEENVLPVEYAYFYSSNLCVLLLTSCFVSATSFSSAYSGQVHVDVHQNLKKSFQILISSEKCVLFARSNTGKNIAIDLPLFIY